jgi:hypothetical protein
MILIARSAGNPCERCIQVFQQSISEAQASIQPINDCTFCGEEADPALDINYIYSGTFHHCKTCYDDQVLRMGLTVEKLSTEVIHRGIND